MERVKNCSWFSGTVLLKLKKPVCEVLLCNVLLPSKNKDSGVWFCTTILFPAQLKEANTHKIMDMLLSKGSRVMHCKRSKIAWAKRESQSHKNGNELFSSCLLSGEPSLLVKQSLVYRFALFCRIRSSTDGKKIGLDNIGIFHFLGPYILCYTCPLTSKTWGLIRQEISIRFVLDMFSLR